MQAPQEQKRSWNPLVIVLALSGFFGLIFVLLASLYHVFPGSSQRGDGGSAVLSSGAVGVVEVTGVIMDSKRILAKLERLEENERVKAIVIRLNSPGGAVAPSQEIYQAIKRSKKPVVASMGSVAASGAYYIACAAQKVFANPGTLTGSIGVIMEFANLQKLYDWAKIQRYAVKTGRFKNIGAEYREMSAEEKKLLQDLVDDVLSQFKGAVAEGRGLSDEDVRKVADGRIFSGAQAHALKLVDELGSVQDAIREAGRLGQIKGKPSVIYMDKKKSSFLEFFLEDASSAEGAGSSRWSAGSGSGLKSLDRILVLMEHAFGSGLSPQDDSGAALGFAPGLYWLFKTP